MADMEAEIDAIANKWTQELIVNPATSKTLKLAILDAYRAGMEAARAIFTA